MSKSRARFLAELLGTDGLVKTSKSALAGADSIIDLDTLPSIPNSKLTNSSITINSNDTSLGGSVTLTTANVAENTNLYYTNARADARIAAATTDDLSEGSSNLYYTDARADARVTLIVDSAPSTLNTLNELAAALGDDANFSTTVTNSIAAKLPLAGGTMTGTLAMGANAITSTGTISSGAITSSGGITAKRAVLTDDGSSSPLLKISADDGAPWAIQLYREDLSAGPLVYASSGNTFSWQGHMDIRSGFDLKINTTTVIDSSRNITAGTISSGAITSSGTGTFNNRVSFTDGDITSLSTGIKTLNNGGLTLDLDENNEVASTDFRIRLDRSSGASQLVLDASGNLDIEGAITSTGSSSFGDVAIGGAADSNYDLKVYGLARFQGAANFVSTTNPIQVGGLTIVDSSRNLTNIGTISSGAITSSLLVSTIVDPGNPSPSSNELRVSGYGVIGNRGNLYLTNSNASGQIVFGISGAHNANPKLTLTTTGATFAGTISSGNITTTGYLRGPSTFTIDPAAHGDNTGTVVIAGNLQVDGTTTTINSTTLTVDDLNITLASGAANAAAANGAGINIDGASATLIYTSSDDSWAVNKRFKASSDIRLGSDGVRLSTDGNGEFGVGYGQTATNNRFTVYNNTTAAFRILPNGNVGIGTASPNSTVGKLDIAGSATNYSTSPMITFTDTTGATDSRNWSIGNIAINYGDFHIGCGDSNSDYFDATSHSKFMIDKDGNVGIGTTSPTMPLSVQAASNAHAISMHGRSDGYSELYGASNDGSTKYSFLQSHSAQTKLYTLVNTPLLFGTNSTERMRLSEGGVLYIGSGHGTSSPSDGVIAAAYASGYNNAGGDLEFYGGRSTGDNAGGEIRFFTGAAGSSGTQINAHTRRMTIDADGNVGIGTDSPSEKLDVAGTALVENAKLKAIAESNTDTAVDVFVYDTRKDSDGGAWRKRTQNTSWYNETLNTATRGARKEFPCVAVIVYEEDQLSIYDGDDPELPMWMVINAGGGNPLYSGGTSNACEALNGEIIAGNGSTTVSGSLGHFNFIKDLAYLRISTSSAYNAVNIAKRNTGFSSDTITGTTGALVDRTINDVAMTVLPNAPIDADTGLPVPTIAVATNGGVSVIKDDGIVVDITHTNYTASHQVKFLTSGGIAYTTDTSSNQRWLHVDYTLPSSDNTKGIGYSGASDDEMYHTVDGSTYTGQSMKFSLDKLNAGFIVTNQGDITVGSSQYGIGLIARNPSLPSEGLIAEITSDYNTGWMVGDIKLATLSDTDDTNVTGTELVTNGTFASNTTGWAGSGTLTQVSGRLRVTGGQDLTAYQVISTVVGKYYTISFDVVTLSGTKAGLQIINGSQSNITAWTLPNLPVGSYSTTFLAGTSTNSIIFGNYAASSSSSYAEYDNISVRLAEEDRSVNGNGLQVFGTVTKTAVATGAELVGYSGFSSSNYLQQPYNADLNFGTSDFSFSGWFYSTSVTSQGLFSRVAEGLGGTQSGFAMNTAGSGVLGWAIYTTGLQSSGRTNCGFGFTPAVNVWNHVVAMRKSGIMYMYLNGVLDTNLVPANTNNITDTSNFPALKVGILANSGSPATATKMALWRISATAPSEEQIKKMYNDEKHLFQENAKATLYGTSDAVTALAYDDDTELLHAGTSAGRSVFQGLNRVDNTTDAVGAAISASNGFIVEE